MIGRSSISGIHLPPGNLKLGWSNTPIFKGDQTKVIEIDAKDKIFSLSSVKSAAMA